MYKWYEEAGICIAYLCDHIEGVHSLSNCLWFTRCWTLQERIALSVVNFFDKNWGYFGSKLDMCTELTAITGIPELILNGGDPRSCSIAQRMSWASHREAIRMEDEAYRLLGLFDVSMNTLYGTGRKAFQDLQEKLLQKDDHSIFAWDRFQAGGRRIHTRLLADSPADFASCRETRRLRTTTPTRSINLHKKGFDLKIDPLPLCFGVYTCVLDCTSSGSDRIHAIFLWQLDSPQQYARIIIGNGSIQSLNRVRLGGNPARRIREMYVYHEPRGIPVKILPGIHVRYIGFTNSKARQRRIELLSRISGPVRMKNDDYMMSLPKNECGTVGQMYLSPSEGFTLYSRPVSWVKLGLNADFYPSVCLGLDKDIKREVRDAISESRHLGDHGHRRHWNNNWLVEALSNVTVTNEDSRRREMTPSEYFHKRGFARIEADSESGIQSSERYLGFDVSFSLENCPREWVPASASQQEAQTWKVWTSEMTENRSKIRVSPEANWLATGAAFTAAVVYLTNRNS